MPSGLQEDRRLCVAPMMAWTDRHCRFLHRLCSPNALLFTEMITTGAILNGDRERLLRYHPAEHPVVLQLGGSAPEDLAQATKFAERAGFDEINLNVGCPSSRVQRGSFGACLMLEPQLVAACVDAMAAVTDLPISVKCRLGVDDNDSDPLLFQFVETVADAGTSVFYLHARKALLSGLSPAQNRQVPPLQYERVYRLKARFPELTIVINGGFNEAAVALAQLDHVDGVMLGRAAYHRPLLLAELDQSLYGTVPPTSAQVMSAYVEYMDGELSKATRLHDMTRHVLGLFNGRPGARRYRQILSQPQRLRENDRELVREALAAIRFEAA